MCHTRKSYQKICCHTNESCKHNIEYHKHNIEYHKHNIEYHIRVNPGYDDPSIQQSLRNSRYLMILNSQYIFVYEIYNLSMILIYHEIQKIIL